MKYLYIFCLLIFHLCLNAQTIIGAGVKWNDSFSEWIIHTEEEGEEGTLSQTWQLQADWTHWSYSISERDGTIARKWKDDPTLWELRSGGKLVEAQMIWHGDVREWRIREGSKSLNFVAKWNNLQEWVVESRPFGKYKVQVLWSNDPRDWEVLDDLGDEISFEMKLLMVFIALHHATPKV